MKRGCLLIFAVLFVALMELSAQSARSSMVSGVVVDVETTLPVVGATIELVPDATPNDRLYYSTEADGAFHISRLSVGDYTIIISFWGYTNEVRSFSMSSGGKVEIPTIEMTLSAVEMEAVVKEVKAIRASQHGDTLSYNASSFKVAADADVEGLIQKMPGITIEDGVVTAQGEEVKKIYVDGREFFGNDVTTALKSLPAEMVASVEVYDKLSDNAEMSGIDDGEGSKAINIVTRSDMRKGAFGKLYGGGGYEVDAIEGVDANKYIIGGSVNVFNDDSRLTILGLANNVNQTNFSFEDIMDTSESSQTNSSSESFMVQSVAGVSEVAALGLNYSDYWGEKDELKLQGSYFFNQTQTYNLEERTKWYDSSGNVDEVLTDKDTRNLNHRLSGRVDWDINSKHKLMIRPSFSYQMNDPYSVVDGKRYGDSYVVENGYLNGYRDISSVSDGYWSGYNASLSLNYRLRLNTSGRMVTVSGYYSANDYSNEFDSQDLTHSKIDGVWQTFERYRYKTSPSQRRNANVTLMYSEPLTKRLSMNINYKYSNNVQESTSTTYNTDENYENWEIYEDASTRSKSVYDTHGAGLGLRYYKSKTNVMFKVFYQNSSLESDVKKSSGEDSPRRTFADVTYSTFANININKENSIKLFMNSYINNPSITKLQNIYSIGNYMSRGNPDLDPSYSNRLNLRYTHSNLEHGRTMMMSMTVRNTMDYIGNHIVYNPSAFEIDGTTYEPLQYTIPVNVDDFWEVYSRFTLGLPMDFIKSNFNVGAGVTYSLIPSVVGGEVQSDGDIEGGELTHSDNVGYRLYATLGSNISESVDFTIRWNGRYNIATNTSDSYNSLDEYFNHKANASIKVVFGGGFTFTGSTEYTQYVGVTDSYNEESLMCNLFVGKKVFKNNRGEIIAGVFDVFDDNSSFWRTTGTNYSQTTTNSVIGRYYSLQLVYNLRAFAKNASQDEADYRVGSKKM